MPDLSQNEGVQGQSKPARQPHHISSIAHLFFSEDEMGEPLSGASAERKLVVTCFNESRISAYACAGLVAGSRQLAAGNPARSVHLLEDANVLWSAASFLTSEETAAVTSDYTETGGALHWSHWPALPDERLSSLEALAGARRAAPVGWDAPRVGPGGQGLFACLLEREMGQWGPAFRLGRLLGLLEPSRLEIIIFPDSWAKGNDRAESYGGGNLPGTAQAADLLARCRSLTRAVSGTCPVTITALGEGEGESQNSAGQALQKIATRLAGDIWVDPNS